MDGLDRQPRHALGQRIGLAEVELHEVVGPVEHRGADAVGMHQGGLEGDEGAHGVAREDERAEERVDRHTEDQLRPAARHLLDQGALAADEAEKVRTTLLAACRWQYIVSGVMEPRFQKTLFSLVDEAQAGEATAAPAWTATPLDELADLDLPGDDK